ncbi:hypothetical protein C6383_01200, partial [Pseudomonas syringae pv. actinidiae]
PRSCFFRKNRRGDNYPDTGGKRNLTEFFADWGLLKVTDTEVWNAVSALGFPYPSQRLSAIRPYRD